MSENTSSSSSTGKRTREAGGNSVDDTIPAVQLHQSESVGKCRIMFPDAFGSRDLRLIEVPDDLLAAITKGGDLKIVGDESKADAVLCSATSTYSLRKVETSNQIYLVAPSSSKDFLLECSIRDYYEVKPMAGRIGGIKDLLQNHQYEGLEREASKDKSLFLTQNALWKNTQASDTEMETALHALGVVQLEGFMRMISPKAANEVCRELLDTAIVSSWDLSRIVLSQCHAAMPSADRVILHHVLNSLGTTDPSDASGETWVLDSDKVAKKTAHMLFEHRESGGNVYDLWPVQDFLLEWGARTPGLKKNPEELLNGIAIIVRDEASKAADKKAAFRYVPAAQVCLMSLAADRLKYLFTIKSKYELEELKPYLGDLVGGAGQAKSLAELLLANTRLVEGRYYMVK